MNSIEKKALEERRAYFREWRAAHRESVRLYNQNYWQRRAEKALAEEADVKGKTNEKK